MRIAYLTSIYARASDTFIRSEVLALRERGHTVDTYSMRREAADAAVSDEVRREQSTTDYILERGGAALAMAFLRMAWTRPASMGSALALAWRTRSPGLKALLLQGAYLIEASHLSSQLLTRRTDILHNHIAEGSATVAMLASTISGVPFSMTVHGPGIFFHPQRWALAEKIHRAAFTACISEFCRSQCMVFAAPADWPKLHIVRCVVGRDFADAPIVPIPEAPRLVCVGRLCAEKGMLVLVEAVARHVESGGQCELVLVGDGPMRAEIERLIMARGLPDFVRILGWQGSDAVRKLIESSRALVLPSFSEGLPVVIMESLALGRPVITTQIAGIPELVLHGENGWLVAPGSVDELTIAIGQAVQCSTETLHRMGQRGAVRVAHLHSQDVQVDRLAGLLARHALQPSGNTCS